VQCTSLLSQLFILHKTIRHGTIRNHMHHAGSHDIQIPVVSWLWEGEILYIHWFSTRCYHMRWWYKRKKWWWHVYSQIWLELHWWVDSPGVLLSTHDPELWDSYYQMLLKTIRLVVKILFEHYQVFICFDSYSRFHSCLFLLKNYQKHMVNQVLILFMKHEN